MARLVIVTEPQKAEEYRRGRLYGFEVHVAHTQVEAEQLAKEHPADLVVLDLTHCKVSEDIALCETARDILNTRSSGQVPKMDLKYAISRPGRRELQAAGYGRRKPGRWDRPL